MSLRIYGWGSDASGQLGDSNLVDRSVPVSAYTANLWVQLVASQHTTVALTGANGLAYAWGSNASGQLGIGSIVDQSVPTSVSSAMSWVAIACGNINVAAINGTNGLAYAWGSNACGQIGDNSTTDRSFPTSVSSGTSWKQIACGHYHTAAIAGATGLAYTWGYNPYGQLGTGNRTSYSVPTSVSSTISWKQIACGQYHTAAIAGATGLAYTWGV